VRTDVATVVVVVFVVLNFAVLSVSFTRISYLLPPELLSSVTTAGHAAEVLRLIKDTVITVAFHTQLLFSRNR